MVSHNNLTSNNEQNKKQKKNTEAIHKSNTIICGAHVVNRFSTTKVSVQPVCKIMLSKWVTWVAGH
jgi:hypothetical protein